MISRPRISSSRRPASGGVPRNDSARDFGKSVSEREEVGGGGGEGMSGTNEISRGAQRCLVSRKFVSNFSVVSTRLAEGL